MNTDLFKPFNFEQAKKLKIIDRLIEEHTPDIPAVYRIQTITPIGVYIILPNALTARVTYSELLKYFIFSDTGAKCGCML